LVNVWRRKPPENDRFDPQTQEGNPLMKMRLALGLTAVLAALVPGASALGGLTPDAPVRGIATFDAVPNAAQVAALQAVGLTVQPMKHLPLALVRGTAGAMEAAVGTGAANDVYPDERIELLDQASADAMGAAGPRGSGLTGKGVTVAVIDSGCDASHPDLADHVTHNVKLYSAEYVNIAPDSSNTVVVPIELGPYQNSDLGSGHGTHVAGIIAADGHTAPEHIGVAPDANLVCYSIGEVLFTTAVVTAYDHLLDQPQLWGVKVINNSWGNSFQQFDPRSPVAVATKAVADLGVNVMFAAGNSGRTDTEMSLNPFSEAPWVTSVAAEDINHVRGSFSSNGLQFDNSQPVTIGAGGHTVFTGNRIGIYHPDVTAPGVAISSTCDTAGTAVGPCPPGSNTTASGTSMASPHAAGAAAVLLQANPSLTIDQVRSALQATAAPVTATAGGPPLGFWQVGYGHIDLASAVDLVRASGYARQISRAQAAADRRVLGSTGYTVPTSDFWTWDAPRASVAGTESRTFTTDVPSTTTHLKVTLSHPSLAAVGSNGMNYVVTVIDGTGQVLGKTTESASGAGTASLLVDLQAAAAHSGTFTFQVSGQRSVSDPDTLDSESALGRVVVLQVAQARK
jgi:serine protease AprX